MDAAGSTRGSVNSEQNREECEFVPSKLGTKEYWDEAYTREMQTFKEIGDVGEIWFGEESMARVVQWLEKENIPQDASVLDIGTGNGMFLVELAKCGFTNLTGIDYSPASVELAKNIMAKEKLTNIRIMEEDFLSPSPELSGFDVCIDKGTFDVISLNPANAAENREQYARAVRSVLKDDGLFIITSCNWTKDQLLSILCKGFEIQQELPTPSFQFGGRTGNSVTALVLKRKN